MTNLDGFFDAYDHPITVVTVALGEEIDGCVVAFSTQCSIFPPRLLVCLSVLNRTTELAENADALGVHLLGENQYDLAERFGSFTGKNLDKFAAVAWHHGVTGAPILDDCAGYVEGRILRRFKLGDHVGHLIEPSAFNSSCAFGTLRQHVVAGMQAGHTPDEILIEPTRSSASNEG